MRHNLSLYVRPLLFNVLLWVCGVTLLLMSKETIKRVSDSISDSSLDLTLVLGAYLLLFLLSPIRAWTNRRLYKLARRHGAHRRPNL